MRRAMRAISDVVRFLVGQERAVDNARTAATQLSRRRVERLEVELYFADRETPLGRDEPVVGEGDGARRAQRR
jgi:hypothetical protein